MKLQLRTYFLNKILLENDSSVIASSQNKTACQTCFHHRTFVWRVPLNPNLQKSSIFVLLFFFSFLQKIVNIRKEGKVGNDQMFIKFLIFYNCSTNYLKQWVSYVTRAFRGLPGNLSINTQASKALFRCLEWGICSSD